MVYLLIFCLLVLAVMGAPLYAVLLGGAIVGYHATQAAGADVFVFSPIAQKMISLCEQAPHLMAIPLFTFAGYLMAEAKTAERLVRLSRAVLGWLPGGLAIVVLVTCAFFTTFTGASGVTIVAMGGLMLPALLKEKYPENFSLGLLTSSGSIGLLFPPSVPMILFGVVYGLSGDQIKLLKERGADSAQLGAPAAGPKDDKGLYTYDDADKDVGPETDDDFGDVDGDGMGGDGMSGGMGGDMAPDGMSGMAPDGMSGMAPDGMSGMAPDGMSGMAPDPMGPMTPDGMAGMAPDGGLVQGADGAQMAALKDVGLDGFTCSIDWIPLDRMSIEDFFLAGIIPGTFIILILALYCGYVGYRAGVPRIAFAPKEAARALWSSAWEVVIPFALMALIFTGIINLQEAAAYTAVYVFIVEVFVYGDISLRKDLVRIVRESMVLVGAIYIIILVAQGLTEVVVLQLQLPEHLHAFLSKYVSSQWSFLLFLNVFLLIVGTMMDIFSAIVVVLPLVAPLAYVYGVDPYHLGIVFLVNLEIGYMTPPFGMNLFIASFRFNRPVLQLYKVTLPFVGLLLICLVVLTYMPWLTVSALALMLKLKGAKSMSAGALATFLGRTTVAKGMR